MKYVVAVLVGVVLAGCSTNSDINYNIERRLYDFNPAASSEYDFDVKLERGWGPGFNTDKISDRLMIIKQMLGDTCPNPKIINETFISRGKSGLGYEKGTHLIKVSCPK